MEFIFATHNDHKLREVSQQFPDFVQFKSLASLNYRDEIPETRHTIADNAAQKAETVWDLFGKSCFAEDTGLQVRALNDEPNVYTARYAGEHRSSADNIQLLLKNLAPHSDRYAKFVTVFALMHQAKLYLFEGICEGTIATEPAGQGGFGYDPIFIPKGYEISFAEMDAATKNQISHRGKALRAMLDFIKKEIL